MTEHSLFTQSSLLLMGLQLKSITSSPAHARQSQSAGWCHPISLRSKGSQSPVNLFTVQVLPAVCEKPRLNQILTPSTLMLHILLRRCCVVTEWNIKLKENGTIKMTCALFYILYNFGMLQYVHLKNSRPCMLRWIYQCVCGGWRG